MKITIKIFLLFAFLGTLAIGDELSGLTASNTNIQPGDDVNLTIDYVVTKKYQLHLNAYKEQTNDELSPTFIAQDLRHVTYKVPDDMNYNIKIIASLVEDGQVINDKFVILNNSLVPDGLYFCEIGYSNSSQEYHPVFTNCFKPDSDVEYNIGYGDDAGAAIVLVGADKEFVKNLTDGCKNSRPNTLALSDANVNLYNIDMSFLSSSSTQTTVYARGCCTTAAAYASGYNSYDLGQIYSNPRDTENRISAKYNQNSNSVTVYFRGGYFPCSCYETNCCGETRSDTYTVYIKDSTGCDYLY